MSDSGKANDRRPKLKRLLVLQALYSAASIIFLLISGYLQATTGSGLSAAPVAFSLTAFAVYSGCLFLPRFGFLKSYRVAMIPALLLFGGGGVIGNIVSFATEYSRRRSLPEWIRRSAA